MNVSSPNKGGCLLRIQALHQSFKSAELRLADYVLEQPSDVLDLTIHDLEEKSGSSYATIIRFCKKVGFAGFKEFKASLAEDLIQGDDQDFVTTGFPIDLNDSVESIIQKTFSQSAKVLDDTHKMLNPDVIETVANKLVAAREILFIGTGTSGMSAQYAYTRFMRIGFHCSSETDATLYKVKTSCMDEQDLLFAISGSGRSAGVVDAAQLANEKGVTVISLTDFAISPLTRTSDINLYTTPRNASLFLQMDIPLILGQIAILDILFSCCCQKMGLSAVGLYHETKSAADREKITK